MPSSEFYAGLPLAEQLEKLVDHHHDPQVRHISADEAAILHSAASRLRAGVSRKQRKADFDQFWQRLGHLYETTIHQEETDHNLFVISVPIRSIGTLQEPSSLGIAVLREAPPSARSVQLSLNLMLSHLSEPDIDLESGWDISIRKRSPPSSVDLGHEENALLNRVLYQPTVAIEESPPVFTTLSTLVAAADAADWLAFARDSSGDPVTILKVGGALLVLSVARGPAAGLREGLRERLYEWSRPTDEAAGMGGTERRPDPDEKGSKSKKPKKDKKGKPR